MLSLFVLMLFIFRLVFFNERLERKKNLTILIVAERKTELFNEWQKSHPQHHLLITIVINLLYVCGV